MCVNLLLLQQVLEVIILRPKTTTRGC